MPESSNAKRWFHNARLGLFIHWGPYALLGRGEQVLFREHLVPSQYRKLARTFNPKKFDARKWAAFAKDSGFKYAVLTTKHHDGFCLFDTTTTDYSSAETAAGRDLVGEYVRAFRRAGLRVGLYFSLADWNYPAYFNGPATNPAAFKAFLNMTHAQVSELCANYGKIDLLWFDGAWPHSVETWQAKRLERMIRRRQPRIIINNRLFNAVPGTGDYDTPEQHIPGGAPPKDGRPWESCLTSTYRWWGWHRGDRLWKSPREIITALCNAAGGGGNLILNVGPKPDGTLPAPFLRRMRDVGQWLRTHGEAIYGTRGSLCETVSIGFMTVKGNSVYLLVTFWPGRELHLCGLRNRVRSARILGRRGKVRVVRQGEHIYLRNLPAKAPDPCCTVIKLDLVGAPKPYPWAKDRLWQGDAARMAPWASS